MLPTHVSQLSVAVAISLSSWYQEVLIQNVPHHFQITLLPAVGSLIILANCGGQLTQLFRTLESFLQLSVAIATSSSSWYHSQPSSPLNRSQSVSESVSQLVSDKGKQ